MDIDRKTQVIGLGGLSLLLIGALITVPIKIFTVDKQAQPYAYRKTEISRTLHKEKVLTISARDYVESIGKELSDYDMVGIHDFMDGSGVHAPERTEVIVDLEYGGPHNPLKSGTALIPKE